MQSLKTQQEMGSAVKQRTVFSGIQPSGDMQLGNYLGAVKGWAERQAQKNNYFCIVDLHAITARQDPEELLHQSRSLAAMLFARRPGPGPVHSFRSEPCPRPRGGVLAAQLRDASGLAGAHDAVQRQGGRP